MAKFGSRCVPHRIAVDLRIVVELLRNPQAPGIERLDREVEPAFVPVWRRWTVGVVHEAMLRHGQVAGRG
jgi:hypothetical protein